MIYGRHKIKQLRLDVQSMFLSAEQSLMNLPFDVYITETYRTLLTQLCYYAQGRAPIDEVNEVRKAAGLPETRSTAIITHADGIKNRSKHQDKIALDVVPYDANSNRLLWDASEGTWLQLGAIAEQYGFEWGGNWKSNPAATLGWDCPHWEVKDGGNVKL